MFFNYGKKVFVDQKMKMRRKNSRRGNKLMLDCEHVNKPCFYTT